MFPKNVNYFFLLFFVIIFEKIYNRPKNSGSSIDKDLYDLLGDEDFRHKDDFFDDKRNNNFSKRSNELHNKINNKEKKLKEIREKIREFSRRNNDLKIELLKYHLYFFIAAIFNILLSLFIISSLFSKIFFYLKQKISRENNLIVSFENNESKINVNDNKNKDIIISNSSFVIHGINDKPEIDYSSLDKSGNVAPVVNILYEHNKN
jgi:hypothetical protein